MCEHICHVLDMLTHLLHLVHQGKDGHSTYVETSQLLSNTQPSLAEVVFYGVDSVLPLITLEMLQASLYKFLLL